jgi:hypothetical protein
MQGPADRQFVEEQIVPMIGGRRFWVYRADPPPGDQQGDELVNAAFAELDARFQEDRSGPVGICVPIADLEAMRRHREAIWPGTELLYAGSREDGSQLRIRYFDEAAIGPALPNSPTLAQTRLYTPPLEDQYRIVPLAEAEGASADDVLALWAREAAVPEAEAQRRVHEVHLVAIDGTDGVVGVSSAYLQRSAQLGLDLWYYRAFVAKAHRRSSLAVHLALQGRDLLEGRFVNGEDTRAPGIIYEVENPGLKQYFNKALWLPTEFTFIGENERGDHVRVHYFPGAEAPGPQ